MGKTVNSRFTARFAAASVFGNLRRSAFFKQRGKVRAHQKSVERFFEGGPLP
jgi:hypothetical protein